IPTVIIAGPLFAQVAAKWVPIGTAGAASGIVGDVDLEHGEHEQSENGSRRPSFAWTLTTILSPVVLMLIRAAADVCMSTDNPIFPFLEFIGDPIVALLVAVLLAIVTFCVSVGFSLSELSTKMGDSLKPI